LKHGFPGSTPGEVHIELRKEVSNQVDLSVSDNGVGIPESLDIGNSGTLGLQLVLLLTDQLGGNLSINRSNPTRFLLRFPINRADGAS
jgi:two-component sensor histidine kinase